MIYIIWAILRKKGGKCVFWEKRTSTYINWKNPNVSSACFRKYVDSKNQNVATDSTWWIEFQVSTSFLHLFIFVKLHFSSWAFLLFYFVLTQLRIISWNWVTRQSRPFNSWADWELRRSWKFVLITMIILSDTLGFMASPCYKSQRIEEKMWKNSKKESEKFCNSLSILYSFVHGVKLSISFQTVVNEKKIGKIILILL